LVFNQTPFQLIPPIAPSIQNYSPSGGEMGISSLSPGAPALQKQTAAFDTQGRVVVKNSDLSLVVNDVQATEDKVVAYAKNQGGFMVNASFNRPSESPYASITVRVPVEKLDKTLSYYRSLGVKVASENLVGTDVTNQYTDIQAHLDSLKKTQAKFNDLLEKATQVQDIISIQQELENLQQQIDSWIGQQKALDENAKLTLITVYLSTDELALPYTPDTTFRPAVVFKQAVRSLLNTIRLGAEGIIWLAVYSILFIPVILIYIAYKRYRQKKS